jgi:hypothetical protein
MGSGERVKIRDVDILGLEPPGKGAVTEVLKAEPMSLKVSDRALTVIAGAIAGT